MTDQNTQTERALTADLTSPEEITSAIADYLVNVVLSAVDKGEVEIRIVPLRSERFSATITRYDADRFEIKAHTGLAGMLCAGLALPGPNARESLEDLSEAIFGTAAQSKLIAESLVAQALIFILLHEYGHVAAGHFELLARNNQRNIAAEFDEANDVFSLGESTIKGRALDQLIELEADLVAFNLQLDLAYPMFVANDEVAKALGTDMPGWEERLLPQINTLVFYAAALALSFLSVNRAVQGVESTHPLPLTRVLHLAALLMRRTVSADWQSAGVEHKIRIDDNVSQQLRTQYLPSLLNAIEICDSCCRNLGHVLRQPQDGEDTRAAFTNDFIAVLKNGARTLRTPEGRQMRELNACQGEFTFLMKAFRVRSWWS